MAETMKDSDVCFGANHGKGTLPCSVDIKYYTGMSEGLTISKNKKM